jgi:hypothetical protein
MNPMLCFNVLLSDIALDRNTGISSLDFCVQRLHQTVFQADCVVIVEEVVFLGYRADSTPTLLAKQFPNTLDGKMMSHIELTPSLLSVGHTT